MQHAPLARVIAHRGASIDQPENTLAALREAHAQGAASTEVDASTSADGVPFLHHDDRLDRCTTGTGFLSDHSADELDRLSADRNHSAACGEPLPRLAAALDLLLELGMSLNLEIKPRRGLEVQTTAAICDLLAGRVNNPPVVLSSFSEAALLEARRHLPDTPRALITGAVPAGWRTRCEAIAASNLHCSGSQLSAAMASEVLEAGLGLYCYTINEPELAQRLFDMGVHGIITDVPGAMRDFSGQFA